MKHEVAEQGGAGQAAGTTGGKLQAFLAQSAGYAALPRVAYTPCFSLEAIPPPPHGQGTQWWYIRDGAARIGLIQTLAKEIEMFCFRPPADGRGPRYDLPEVYHWANLYGARIQLYGTQENPPLTAFELAFVQDQGETLVFTLKNSFEGGFCGANEYRLTWDERLGYVWQMQVRYTMTQPRAVEFNNLLAGGVAESRESHKRWQKTVRALADGRIAYVWHNPLNIPLDDIAPGGFVGFVTEEAMNPFVELLATSTPVFIDTCGMWYDQHIFMRPPAVPAADGSYQIEARYRFLSLPGQIARELEAAAVPVEAATEPGLLGFQLNRVCDFEQYIPVHGGFNGGVWEAGVRCNATAHSGHYSLRVRGKGPRNVASIAPIGGGPGLTCESKKRYRLRAWIKTDLKEGVAYACVEEVVWHWKDLRATRQTPELAGRTDWSMVEVEFTPTPHDPFLVVRLCVHGRGVAWFDDVLLEELP
jgi:hypothetical protein